MLLIVLMHSYDQLFSNYCPLIYCVSNIGFINITHNITTTGCGGFEDKSQEIFDGNIADSVVSQLCDGPDPIANCDLGIATHGWSQGAHLAVLGEKKVHTLKRDTLLSFSFLIDNIMRLSHVHIIYQYLYLP